MVHDTLGNALHEVQVLVLSDASGQVPLADVKTDDRGRFLVTPLPPGIYRIAALKEGYLVFLGQVNTLFRSSLDMVLRPVPPAEERSEIIPADASWILRLPTRSLLQETDPSALMNAEGRGGPGVYRPGLTGVLDGQIDHWMAVADRLPRTADTGGDVRGAETRVRLASSLGQRGSIALHGSRESLDRSGATGEASATAFRQGASSLQLDGNYDASRRSSLRLNAGFAEQDLDTGIDAPRHAGRSWGYDATWAAQLSDESRLTARFGYANSWLVAPLGAFPAGPEAGPIETSTFSSGSMAAIGSFESIAAERHRVRIEFGSDRMETVLQPASAVGTDYTIGPTFGVGWNVRLDAEDHWSLSAPVTLIYGVGYDRSLDGRDASVVGPRVGGIWAGDAATVRIVLAYDLATEGIAGQPGLRGDSPGARRGDAFGYLAEVEAPLPFGLKVKGELGYDPFEVDPMGALRQRFDPSSDAIYAGDGAMATSRSRVTLEHAYGGLKTYAQWIRGSAEGDLAPVFAAGLPVQVSPDRRIAYQGGLLGVTIGASGTDVRAEYRRVEDGPIEDEGGWSGLSQGYVELRLAQDVLMLQSRGMSCRVLFAARTTPWRAASSPDAGPSIDSATLAALDRRVSAGLSVAF